VPTPDDATPTIRTRKPNHAKDHKNPDDPDPFHPEPSRTCRRWFVHNGVVFNHDSLVRRFQLAPKTQCDSEVLGLLIARFPGALGMRAARAAEESDGNLAILGLWRNPTRLVIVRNGNPLCFGETSNGFYFGSLPDELPGEVLSLTDQYTGVLTYNDDGIHHEAYSIGS
jgi:glucosamine 6-phosphate synthetase-like amidotransferase/phosphosugar isomerase protein